MQQVVDLQKSKAFRSTGVELLSIAVDDPGAWAAEASKLDITLPLISDPGAKVAGEYGVMQWAMGNEPGHTFVLVDKTGRVAWLRDYGAADHGGLMYVEPTTLVPEVAKHLENP
jgi:peroxiredoxin